MINNEFLLFFKNNKFEQKYEIKRAHVEHSAVSRSLFPEVDDCIYLKIYTGKVFSDLLICEMVGILGFLQSNKLIDHFFYIKYYDPDFHLRIRIFAPVNNHMEIKSHLNALLKKISRRKKYTKFHMILMKEKSNDMMVIKLRFLKKYFLRLIDFSFYYRKKY